MAYIPDEVYKQLVEALDKSRDMLQKYNERDSLFLPKDGRGLPIPDQNSYLYGLYNANKALIKRLENLANHSFRVTQDRRTSRSVFFGDKERRET